MKNSRPHGTRLTKARQVIHALDNDDNLSFISEQNTMSIEVTCDDCGREFRVSETSAGKKVRCKCGAPVRVPNDDGDDYEEAAPVRRSGSNRRRKSVGAGSMNGLAIGGGIGLVAMIVIGLLLFRSGANNPLPAPPQTTQVVPANTNNALPVIPQPGFPQPTVPASKPPVAGNNTSPTTPTVPTQPTVPVKPTAPAAMAVVETRWQAVESKFQVGHSGKDAKIAIASGGKFVALDRDIHDTASGDKIWSAPAGFGGGDKNSLQALNADGTCFAEGEESGQKLTVYFKEKVAGETKFELPAANGATKLTFLAFAEAKRLVAGFTVGANSRVAVYDIEKPKKPLKDFTTESFSSRTGAVSDDGKFLAVGSAQSLKVYDLAKGVSAATMAAAANGPQAFSSCSGVAFSPDNEELAAVLSTGLIVWSNRGKLLEEWGDAVTPAGYFSRGGLAYLPDKSGWFVNGQSLFDRASKMVVWELQAASNYNHPSLTLDADHVIVSGGGANNGQVAAIKIPREELAKATKAIADKVDCVVGPYSPLSIVYEVGEPRFASRQEVTNQLHTTLTARLTRLGIGVEEGQPVVLKVVYTEVPGDKIEYTEGRGFGPPIPRPPGFPRSPFDKPGTIVVETKHTFSIVLQRKGDARLWWAANISQDAANSLKGDTTEANVRNHSFEQVKLRIGGFVLPRFIPVDPSIPSLPLKSDLGSL